MSVCAAGSSASLVPGIVISACPKPLPKRPPSAWAKIDCRIWYPVSGRVVVGVEPDLDPVVDVGHGAGEEPGADQEHRHPDDDEGEAPGRHVEQGEEGGEEHQRAAEVADEDEHEHRGAPDDQHRPEVLQRRQRHPEHAPRADDQHLAVLAQVAGEEDDDRDLRELGRLEGERADLDPEVGAVDLLADPRQPRRQQQQQADRRRSCTGSAPAPRSRAGTGSSARRGRARGRTSWPGRGPGRRRSGRSSPARRRSAARPAGTGRGRRWAGGSAGRCGWPRRPRGSRRRRSG